MGQYEFQSLKRKIVSRKDSIGHERPECKTLTESAEDACLPSITINRTIPLTQNPILIIITKLEKWRRKKEKKKKKKQNQRGNGGRKSEKRILMARNEIERREWEDLMGEKKRIFVERNGILKGKRNGLRGKSRVNGHWRWVDRT